MLDYRRRLDEIEARLPKDTVWHLADGSEFRSHLTIMELIAKGWRELRAGGPHPIFDAAQQTVRSESGDRLHELFRAVAESFIAYELRPTLETEGDHDRRRG